MQKKDYKKFLNKKTNDEGYGIILSLVNQSTQAHPQRLLPHAQGHATFEKWPGQHHIMTPLSRVDSRDIFP